MSSTTERAEDEGVNAAQRANWDAVFGPKWIRREALMETSHAGVAALLLAAAAARPGEAVLEIGCGTGTLLTPLAQAVGPAGAVAGIDISTTMLDRARERAPSGARVMLADAQTAKFDASYDLMLSRFGVMFFDDPVAAFANLRGALRPGGRLCFVCWAGLAENLHWRAALAAAVRYLGPVAPTDPLDPGPLAFADPARVEDVLGQAGFGTVILRTERPDLTSTTLENAVDLAMTMGPAGRLIGERTPQPPVLAAIKAEIEAAYRPYMRGDTVHLPGGVHVVTARV